MATAVFVWLAAAGLALAATLSDPDVDCYNVRVGTQTFAGLYQFTTNTLLVETAEAIRDLGSDIIKFYVGADYRRQYRIALPLNVTNLLILARDEPSCRRTLDMPFRHFILWTYPFGNSDAAWHDGYSVAERMIDYGELYDLTRYLLTNYSNSGKTFYLGHWEGDGYLVPWTTNPPPAAVQGMIDWLNNRQQAIDDAKRATPHTNVNVFCYAEANRVRDAMLNGPTNNQRVINMVVPYVTNLDYLSYSSYDAMNLATPDLYATLDYVEARLPTNKASVIPGERLWIGEYGWGGSLGSTAQEPLTRAYIQRLLNWARKGIPYILFWEIYNNETDRAYWLIDSNRVKVPSYDLHQHFINNARLLVAQFKERSGRLPTDSEFVSLVTPMLNWPLVHLTVANLGALLLAGPAAQVSGQIAQGVYGDDSAAVWVFWGRSDGGTVPGAWEQRRLLGVNTNFNPTTFTACLTNLTPQTNYFFRFYATNASVEAWAPASAQFSTAALDPGGFACRMKIVFTGYQREEPLLNFPLLVQLQTNLPGFAYSQFASASGGDLRFTDAGGLRPIPHEIDEWNTNGLSSVWVRVPALAGTDDFIWAYWGNPAAMNPPVWTTNGTVWSADHLLVWHLRESGLPFTDSAGQHPATSGVAPVSTAGRIGRAGLFNGVSQYLDAGTVNLGDAFTLSAWVKIKSGAADIQTIWANQQGGYGSPGFAFFVNTYLTSDQKVDFASGDGAGGNEATTPSGAVSFGQWHLLTASVNRTNGSVEFFVDSADLGPGAVVNDFANDADLNLGRFTNGLFYFNGVMDEVRIQTGTVSPDWVWASWMTVVSNTLFATYSAVNPRPTLSVAVAQSGPLLTWPASAGVFTLHAATSLVPPIDWSAATESAVLVEGQWRASLSPAGGSRFYRLQTR
jgi:hypothetical protein